MKLRVNRYVGALLWTPCLVDGLSARFANSSSSSVMNVAPANDYCFCLIQWSTTTEMWWDELFSSIAGTMIYTVDTGTNKTIGSSMVYENVTTDIPGTSDLPSPDDGVVIFTTLSSGQDPSITVTQDNLYLFDSFEFWTAFITTIDGTVISTCVTEPVSQVTYTGPGTLPSSYDYLYTSVVNFNGASDPFADAEGLGFSIAQAWVLKQIGVSSCSWIGGDGIGALKGAVTILTETTDTYTSIAQAQTPPPTPTPTLTPTPTAAPTPTPSPGNAVTPNTPAVTPPAYTPPAATPVTPSPPNNNNPSPKANSPAADSPAANSPPANNSPSNEPTTILITLPSTTLTAKILPSSSGYIISSQTLTPGGPAATLTFPSQASIPAITLSAASTGLVYVPSPNAPSTAANIASAILAGLGITSSTPSTPHAPPPPETYVLTLASHTYAEEVLSNGVLLGGQTLSTGGTVVLGGQTLSLASGGHEIVVLESNTGTGTGTETSVAVKTVGTVPVSPGQFTGGVRRNWGRGWEVLVGVVGMGWIVV